MDRIEELRELAKELRTQAGKIEELAAAIDAQEREERAFPLTRVLRIAASKVVDEAQRGALQWDRLQELVVSFPGWVLAAAVSRSQGAEGPDRVRAAFELLGAHGLIRGRTYPRFYTTWKARFEAARAGLRRLGEAGKDGQEARP